MHLKFIEQLTSFLKLKRNQVVIIPGNHDINRKACEAYFNECEADDQRRLSPYWPKWKHYHAFFQNFYKREHQDDFLARVAEVCECRNAKARTVPICSRESQINYLRVVLADPPFVRQYPIGIFENGITREGLDRFITLVDAKYRASDPGVTSEIVYGGSERPSEDIMRQAEKR